MSEGMLFREGVHDHTKVGETSTFGSGKFVNACETKVEKLPHYIVYSFDELHLLCFLIPGESKLLRKFFGYAPSPFFP